MYWSLFKLQSIYVNSAIWIHQMRRSSQSVRTVHVCLGVPYIALYSWNHLGTIAKWISKWEVAPRGRCLRVLSLLSSRSIRSRVGTENVAPYTYRFIWCELFHVTFYTFIRYAYHWRGWGLFILWWFASVTLLLSSYFINICDAISTTVSQNSFYTYINKWRKLNKIDVRLNINIAF